MNITFDDLARRGYWEEKDENGDVYLRSQHQWDMIHIRVYTGGEMLAVFISRSGSIIFCSGCKTEKDLTELERLFGIPKKG